MTEINIRLFATLKDKAGSDQVVLPAESSLTVAEFLRQLEGRYPALSPHLPNVLVAVNQQYAFPQDRIEPGDEVALFPPVSGGTAASPDFFAITTDVLDTDAIIARLTQPEIGAVCVFSGAVRGLTHKAEGDQHLATDYLYYEAYQPMAEKIMAQIAAEIRQRFPKVRGVAIIQRIGRLEVGETTILVACSAGHRHDGIFEAASYGVDRLKEIVPIWKKEVGPDGSTWVEGPYQPTQQDVAP